MKRIVSLAVISALFLAAGYGVYKYSGTRGEVAKDKVLKQIDKWIGDTDIARKDLQKQIDAAKEGADKLQHARITEQVRVERLVKDVQPAKANYQSVSRKLDQQLTELEKVKSDDKYEVAIDKTTYSQKNLEALQSLVQEQTKAVGAAKKDMEEKTRLLTDGERMLSLLKKQEKEAREKASLYEGRQKALEAKLKALEAQQEAAKLLSEGKKSSAVNFEEIEKNLTALEDKTEVDLRKAEEHAATHAEKSISESKGGEDLDETIRKAREALSGQK